MHAPQTAPRSTAANHHKVTFTGSYAHFVWTLLTAYWRGAEKKTAWLFLISVLGFSSLQVHASVLVNYWSNDLYSTLQKTDYDGFITAAKAFPALVLYFIGTFLAAIYLNAQMIMRWRRWMTDYYLSKWLNSNAFYKMRLQGNAPDNPDQRIAQDLRAICGETLTLTISFYQAILNLFTFGVILWTIFGTVSLTVFGVTLEIPGIMMIVSLIYALFSSLVIWKVGRPLIRLDFIQEQKEADFRYSLMRLQERAPEAAMMASLSQEETVCSGRFSIVIQNFYHILRQKIILNVWHNLIINTSTLFPFFIAAPKFFAGGITFGTMMQISGAFRIVNEAFSFLIHNFSSIASWRASIDRIIEFDRHIDTAVAVNAAFTTARVPATTPFSLENVTLRTPTGTTLLRGVSFTAEPGKWTALEGPSGLGKSTLIQTISGNWPFAAGHMQKPDGLWLFAPQKPYFPLLSLTEILMPKPFSENVFYTNTIKHVQKWHMSSSKTASLDHLPPLSVPANPVVQKQLHLLLNTLDLGHLIPELDDLRDWSNTLSLGEQQRISLIRIMLQAPTWIVLDEPTASMDSALSHKAYKLLKEMCPNAGVLVISHSPTVKDCIDHHVDLSAFKA